jgi:DNA replication protein DnaC
MGVTVTMNDETRRKLHEMNIGEFVAAAEFQDRDVSYAALPFDERFQCAVDYAWQEKHNAKVHRLIRTSNLRFGGADINDIHYIERGLDRQIFRELATCQFMDMHSNIVFQGFTGSGKTYLACAIGKQACKQGKRAYYIRMPDLLALRDEASLGRRGIAGFLRRFGGYDLLILDEWLLDKLSGEEKRVLFEIIERRHDCASTVFCTQYRKEDWHSRLGGGVHADAIMDRIVHNVYWIDAGTMNMREHYSKKE